MNRAEHLAWAKKRALLYVDKADKIAGSMFLTDEQEKEIQRHLANALASFATDLPAHPVYQTSPGTRLALELGIFEVQRGPAALRRWIEGFE